jgi:phosphoribosylanthranilate isomerase
MWIKICANTSVEDACLAAELGADAVGFVFAPSKRQVTPEQVAAITPHLPTTLEKIGVFATGDRSEIAEIVRASGLTGIQLHNTFNADLVRVLHQDLGASITIIQTVHWRVDGNKNNADELSTQLKRIAQEPVIDRVLIDSKTTGSAGGTGISFDWIAAEEVLALFSGKLIVAGGLRPENVQAAISVLKPWGVDVASGVEAELGKKDATKLRSFIEASR